MSESESRNIKVGESATAQCYCGKSFLWTKRRKDSFPTCPECTDEAVRRSYDKCRSGLEASIAKITPPRFRLTDTTAPNFNARLWKEVRQWRPTDTHPWLGLVGPTGKCKTRCLYLLLREILIEKIWQNDEDPPQSYASISFKEVPATIFAAKVMERYSDDRITKAAAESFISDCHRTQILLLDDVDKIRVATANGALSAAGSELHALIGHRHAQNLVTLWSANVSPEGIVAGMPENIAAPLAGRIRECSTIFNIK